MHRKTPVPETVFKSSILRLCIGYTKIVKHSGFWCQALVRPSVYEQKFWVIIQIKKNYCGKVRQSLQSYESICLKFKEKDYC